jgi:cytochrome bd ubiquinol oxidase subunit II
MLYIIIIFLIVSLLFYCLFGGADFGAGILEVFSPAAFREKRQKLTYQAIGPVWEANHIWLILVVVILFMGFPVIYSTISTALHIPLTVMLLGIVLRGCFFTFRHYDAYRSRLHRYYTWLFVFASILTPLFLGVTAGALTLGRITSDMTSFGEAFIFPWFNYFSFAVGIFACCIFAFLAAVYLIGEAEADEMRKLFLKQATRAGALVFLAAELDGFPLIRLLLENWLSTVCLLLATVSLPFLWRYLRRGNSTIPRVLAGFQVTMILAAWLWMQYPVAVRIHNAPDLTLFDTQAPEATLAALGWALLIGSLLILPALFYLLRAFKWKTEAEAQAHSQA